jgi:hypothetical protein
VFVRYFIELAMPFEVAERTLLDDPASWMPNLADDSAERGRVLLAQVGFGSGFRIRRRVEVQVGDAIRVPAKTMIPVRWAAEGGSSLLPVMDGDLEIAPFGPERSQLSMNGRYAPPAGALGRAADRALLHRVAEATVRDFVERVRSALEHPSRRMLTTAAGRGTIGE